MSRRGGLIGRARRARGPVRDATELAVARVRAVARVVGGSGVMPVEVQAPAQAACEIAAPRVAAAFGLGDDRETVDEVAAYLLTRFVESVGAFSVDEFQTWRAGR